MVRSKVIFTTSYFKKQLFLYTYSKNNKKGRKLLCLNLSVQHYENEKPVFMGKSYCSDGKIFRHRNKIQPCCIVFMVSLYDMLYLLVYLLFWI